MLLTLTGLYQGTLTGDAPADGVRGAPVMDVVMLVSTRGTAERYFYWKKGVDIILDGNLNFDARTASLDEHGGKNFSVSGHFDLSEKKPG